jgi:hypothetical protein
MTKIHLNMASTILIHYVCACVCLWHDNSITKAFYGRTGLCIFYGRTGLCIILTKWRCGLWWQRDTRSLVSLSMTGVLGGGGRRGRWSNGQPPWFPHQPGVQTRTWFPQSIKAVRREGMTVGSHAFPTAPEADIKTSPPPNYRKNRQLYRGACFRKFPKLSGTKVQNVRTGVLGFLTPVG